MNETCNALSPHAQFVTGVAGERPVAESLGMASLLAEILQNLEWQAWLFEAQLNRQNKK